MGYRGKLRSRVVAPFALQQFTTRNGSKANRLLGGTDSFALCRRGCQLIFLLLRVRYQSANPATHFISSGTTSRWQASLMDSIAGGTGSRRKRGKTCVAPSVAALPSNGSPLAML